MLDLVEEILIIINNDIVSIPRTGRNAPRRSPFFVFMNEWMNGREFIWKATSPLTVYVKRMVKRTEWRHIISDKLAKIWIRLYIVLCSRMAFR